MRSLLLLGAETEDRDNRREIRDNHFTELEIRNTQPDIMVHSSVAILMKLAGEKLTLALSIFILRLLLLLIFFKNIYHRIADSRSMVLAGSLQVLVLCEICLLLSVQVPVGPPGGHGGGGGQGGDPRHLRPRARGGRVHHRAVAGVGDQGRVVHRGPPGHTRPRLLHVGERQIVDVARHTGRTRLWMLLLEAGPAHRVILIPSVCLDVQGAVLVEDGPL